MSLGQHFISAIVTIVIVGGIVLVVTRASPRDSDAQSVKINFMDGTLEMNVDGGRIEHAALLDGIFAQEFSRHGATGWLRDTHAYYSIGDSLLSAAIVELCPDRPGEDPVERQTRVLECEKHALIRELRRLADEHHPPFQYVGRPVKIGVPAQSSHQPPRARANVCRNAGLLGKQLLIVNPQNGNQLTVEATGYYVCVGIPPEQHPDVQLNPIDANDLFAGRPLNKLEDGLAVVL